MVEVGYVQPEVHVKKTTPTIVSIDKVPDTFKQAYYGLIERIFKRRIVDMNNKMYLWDNQSTFGIRYKHEIEQLKTVLVDTWLDTNQLFEELSEP